MHWNTFISSDHFLKVVHENALEIAIFCYYLGIMLREPVSDDVFSDVLSDIVHAIFVHFKHIGAIKHE